MRLTYLFLPLAAALFAVPASAQVLCDPVLDNASCPPGSVNKYCPIVLTSSCTTGKAQVVLSSNEPPPLEYTQMQCALQPGQHYFCEAWPQSGGVTYNWSVRGDMQIDGVSNQELIQINCTFSPRNSITLTVTSPYGLGTTYSVQAPCGDSDIVQ